jgi:hypothetical protein
LPFRAKGRIFKASRRHEEICCREHYKAVSGQTNALRPIPARAITMNAKDINIEKLYMQNAPTK